MSPAPDRWRELAVSLTVEQERLGGLVVRLAVDEPDGQPVVEVELTGDELARLLVGETLAVSGRVGGGEPAVEELAVELVDEHEPTTLEVVRDTEPGEPGDVEASASGRGAYSSALDEPPSGTVPISRTTEVARDEEVVAYVRGRWRDAVVVRSDVGTLLVSYSRKGPLARELRQRVPVGWVRRRR